MFEKLTIPQVVFVAIALAFMAIAGIAFLAYGIVNSPICCGIAFAGILVLSCFIE